MILLWGPGRERALDAVHSALRDLGAPVFLLDQRAVLDTEMELCVDAGIHGTLRCGDARLELGALTGMYLRPYEITQLGRVARAGPASREWKHALAVTDALLLLAELATVRVVNRPAAMASNNSKPYQAGLIRKLGFQIPATLLTTDPAAASEFWRTYGRVIYKSVSGTRSIVKRLEADDVARLEDVIWCPTQFQEYIAGADFRVHVIGDRVIATEIVSTADDYRYAERQNRQVEMRACELPEECASRCRALAASLQLSVAGVDLRLTPQGEWYCFEVNPSPGFTFFQAETGQPIARAIAEYLCAGE